MSLQQSLILRCHAAEFKWPLTGEFYAARQSCPTARRSGLARIGVPGCSSIHVRVLRNRSRLSLIELRRTRAAHTSQMSMATLRQNITFKSIIQCVIRRSNFSHIVRLYYSSCVLNCMQK